MDYILHLAILSSIFGILTVSLNLVMGYTGLLSITHAAFYGIGAYTSAILAKTYGFDFFIAMGSGVISSMIIAFLIGVIMSKFRDDYYALASLGFSIIAFGIMLNWQELTNGPFGIPGIPKPTLFGAKIVESDQFFIFSILFLIVIFLLAHSISKSSFGRVLKTIREDEKTIKIFGYNTLYYKLAIFVITAGMAAIAGSLYASYISFIDPATFNVMESVFIIAMIILGGLANNKGAVIGAVIFILLPELLRFVGFPDSIAGHMRQVIYGLALVLLMLYRPQGLFGEYKL